MVGDMRNKWIPYVKMAWRAKENFPGGSLKYLFVYLKVHIFKCSYRNFQLSIFLFVLLVLFKTCSKSLFKISPVVASRCCSTLLVPRCVAPCWALLTCCIFRVVSTLLCVLFVALGFPSSE